MRLAAIAICVLAVGVVPAVPASAHNGVGAAFKGRAGNDVVYAYDPELLSTGRLDYRLVLVHGKTKDPVYDAHPVVTASRSGTATTEASVTTFGNVFFYNLPNPYPGDWDVHLRITGPLGAGSVDYLMHGVAGEAPHRPALIGEDPGGSNWPYVAGGVGGAFVLAILIFFRFLRQSRARADRASRPPGGLST
jgi:hypothetical protein